MRRESQQGKAFTEGHPLTIGREGQIRIDDSSISRGHAEIRFIHGKLRLRDLDSTNGTFLLIDGNLLSIKESYVDPCQPVVLGNKKFTIKALLALAGIYVSYSPDYGLVIKPSGSDGEAITVETDLDELVSITISRLFGNRATRALDRALNYKSSDAMQ